MKWLIYLFSFLSINLVANQIAMKKLLAVTGEEIFSAEIWTVGGIYLNPFNYLTLYYKYHDAAPTVFQKFLPIAYIGFLLSFLALVCFFLRTASTTGSSAAPGTPVRITKSYLPFCQRCSVVNSSYGLPSAFSKK